MKAAHSRTTLCEFTKPLQIADAASRTTDGGRRETCLRWLWLMVCLLAAWLVALAASSPAAAPSTPPRDATAHTNHASTVPANRLIAIRVGDRKVDPRSYQRGLEAYLREHNAPATDTAALRAYREHLIDQLVVESYARKMKLDRDREFRRRMAEARRRMLFDFVIEREVLSQIQITTESILRYYESHPADFTEPERIQVRHIVTRASSSTEQARQRVVNGEDFARVAAEVSIHASKSQGGLLPAFARGTYQLEFETVAFALNVGELSPVIETELGFHVIEKTAAKPARLKPLEDVAGEIHLQLYEAERKKRVAEFLERLRRQVKIDLIEGTEPP